MKEEAVKHRGYGSSGERASGFLFSERAAGGGAGL